MPWSAAWLAPRWCRAAFRPCAGGASSAGRPVGVFGVVITLAVSPLLGFGAGWLGTRLASGPARRARSGVEGSVRRGEWVTASALAFSHGSNDAQKTMGVVTLLLVASGHLARFAVPLWVKLASGAAITIGTSVGGWRIVRTLGSGIYRIRALDGFVSQGGSATVILGAAAHRRPGEHDPRRRLVDRRCRRRAEAAARPLGGGLRNRRRLADHIAIVGGDGRDRPSFWRWLA